MGVLAASVIAFVLATIIFRISDAVRPGTESGLTLMRPIDPARDHLFGAPTRRTRSSSTATSNAASASRHPGSIQEVHEVLGDQLRYVWRHAPLMAYHPNAQAGAEASEAAALQGKFFEFERGLFADQENQRPSDIIRLARELGLDVDRFERDLMSAEVTARVRDDMLDAEAMGITAVPTLFINGRRHVGPYDAQSLLRVLRQGDDGGGPTI